MILILAHSWYTREEKQIEIFKSRGEDYDDNTD